MKTQTQGDTLRIYEFEHLGSANATHLRELAHACLRPEHRIVEVDLASATFIDSEGLGALISIQKAAAPAGGRVRLVNACASVRQVLRLTRLDQLFEFVPAL